MHEIILQIETLIKDNITNLNNFNNEIEKFKQEFQKQEEIKQKLNALNMGNIKALKTFHKIDDFKQFTENLYNIKSWNIRNETYKERADILKKYKYWQELKELFNESDLTNKYINDDQLVSYFDTMYIMYNILNEINQQNIKDEMKILMEYRIPTPNKNRIDYVLIYRNNIFLLEFGKSDNFNTLNNDFNKKNTQLESYKNSLINVLNEDNIKISSYVCVYLDESSEKNINNNNETFDQLKRTINKTFGKIKNAFECLLEAE